MTNGNIKWIRSKFCLKEHFLQKLIGVTWPQTFQYIAMGQDPFINAICIINVLLLFFSLQMIKNDIFSQYRIVKKDTSYLKQRKRWDYLHRKLAHIKKLITAYDSVNISWPWNTAVM